MLLGSCNSVFVQITNIKKKKKKRWCYFTSGGQESGRIFGAAVCKIQASTCKCYIESSLKDERSCFSRGEKFTVQLPLDCALALWK